MAAIGFEILSPLLAVVAIWTVLNLRSARMPRHIGNLREHLERFGHELSALHSVPFCLAVVGRVRPLDPRVDDELCEMAREAILNAFRHAKASSIHTSVQFTPYQFRIVVSDDGLGIARPILGHLGREENQGFLGMRAGAERIGATLRIDGNGKSGTRVQIELNARSAYA